MFDGLTGKERYYYEEVLRIGREKGDCQELQDIYRQVLALFFLHYLPSNMQSLRLL